MLDSGTRAVVVKQVRSLCLMESESDVIGLPGEMCATSVKFRYIASTSSVFQVQLVLPKWVHVFWRDDICIHQYTPGQSIPLQIHVRVENV